ncbi:MAG: hypothetical protein ACE5JX_16500 [Acidobacteriota bacterium]
MGQYSSWQKLLAMTAIFFSVVVAAYLLVAGDQRRALIAAVGEEWRRLYQSDAAKGIYKLPPPPPLSLEPKVIYTPPPAPSPEPAATAVSTPGEPTGEKREKADLPPQKTPRAAAALEFLKSQSKAASSLLAGEFRDYRFEDWSPLQERPPEFLIDLVARRQSDGIQVHFVWSVDPSRETVRALSQAARDLENDLKTRR